MPATLAASPRAQPRPATWALAGLLVLTGGCGGGLYVDVGGGYGFDDPPHVELAASTDVALPGEVIRLVAAASDDFAVDRVSFYRIDGNRSVLLETDFSHPWQLDTVIPAGAVGRVRYFARAVDDVGQARDSTTVTVFVE
jgi:hypothetical protein